MVTGTDACTTALPSSAVRVTVRDPVALPATNVVARPELLVSCPSEELTFQVKAVLVGHAPPLQLIEPVSARLELTFTDTLEGCTVTAPSVMFERIEIELLPELVT